MKEAIFLSASIPDPKRNPDYYTTADSVAIASAVSALLYVTLGRRPLVWGGHPAITPMVVETCESLGVDYGSWVKLYQSEYFKDEFPEDNKRFKNKVFTSVSKDGSLASSLRDMRTRMLSDNEIIAGVFIGGMEGILDEAELLQKVWPDALILPVASTGGAALILANKQQDAAGFLHTNLEYVGLFHQQLGIDEKELRFTNPEAQPDDPTKRVAN